MMECYYVERVIRDGERGRARSLALGSRPPLAGSGEGRPVLSADLSGWSWGRLRSVLGTVAVALAASVAVPASIQGFVWALREVLELLGR